MGESLETILGKFRLIFHGGSKDFMFFLKFVRSRLKPGSSERGCFLPGTAHAENLKDGILIFGILSKYPIQLFKIPAYFFVYFHFCRLA